VIRRAKFVGGVKRNDLSRRLEVGVVVEDAGLVGVDVILGDAGDLGQDGSGSQRVIQVALLAVEHVGVRASAGVGCDQPGFRVIGYRSRWGFSAEDAKNT
jgi:hypothetical protein